MVYLGYILPPKNQKVYNDDVALALANYNKDLLNASFEKLSFPEQQKLVDMINTTKPANTSTLTVEDYTKLLKDTDKLAQTQTLIWNSINKTQPLDTTKIDVNLNPPTEKMYPTTPNVIEPLGMEPKIKMTPKEMAIASAINFQEQELKRPLTPEEKIDVENKVEKQGRLSREISPSSSSATSPTNSILTIGTDTTISSLLEQIQNLKDVSKADAEVSKLTKNLIKELFKREIEAGKTIYGAKSNAQKEKYSDMKLKLDKNNNLIFINGSPLKDNLLSVSLKLNLGITDGKGLKGKGMSVINGDKNFGSYHLSLPALRKGNLTIYRPKSNSVLVSRRNMSPTLTKIINDIKSTMKFDLNDYDRLKIVEQKTVDHVINLLRMDYPPKMKRALDEENWNLKQRYEILLSEINAGNGGYMVVNELKDILGKLKENKVINKRKYDMIMSALNE